MSSKLSLNNISLLCGIGIGITLGLTGELLIKYLKKHWYNKTNNNNNNVSNPYETLTLLHEYLLMHYGTKHELLEEKNIINIHNIPYDAMDFPAECANNVIQITQQNYNNTHNNQLRCLDVGCAVGRSSFELTRYFSNVVGIDYSHSFIDAANILKLKGQHNYLIKLEGDINRQAVATIDNSINRDRVKFQFGDACNLSLSQFDNTKFDVIMAANLLCRLPNPNKFLNTLPSLINSGGIVVFMSPYSWLPEYTDKSSWLGGYYDNNSNPVFSSDNIKLIMSKLGFVFILEKNLPFFIHETARKNQWSISHLMAFKYNI